MELIDKEKLVEYLQGLFPNSPMLQRVERGDFDYKNYEMLARTFVGTQNINFYCNGYFGRDYDLENARIVRMWEEEYSFDDKTQIIVELEKTNHHRVSGYFDDWQEVYECFAVWTKENGYD